MIQRTTRGNATNRLAAFLCWLAGINLMMTVPAAALAEAGEPVGCATPEYRAMDFRIGHFTGQTADGLPAGMSDVEAVLSGCALIEEWQGAVSGKGIAFFYRSRQEDRWHLNYVNDDGETLELSGLADAEGVTFSGMGSFYGYSGLQRIRWQREPGDAVRQLWQLSQDGGKTWTSVVEIVLTPKAAELP